MREWKPIDIDTIVEHKLLSVQRQRLEAVGEQREALVFDSPDWVNVVPLLDDGRVVLVRQWRYGVRQLSLEVPGGLVDPGESHEQAARRELEEETAYRCGRIERIGGAHPNPALFSNRMSFWLATELEQIADTPEGDGEEELEVVRVPLTDIPRLARAGEITHALALCAFYFLDIADRP
jgi:8-oxo-dGTP pyrophosphatase MutT (NUDIX family)